VTDARLTQHWKKTKPSKSNPDMLVHGLLYNEAESKKAGKAVYRSPVLKISNVSMGLVKSERAPKGEEMIFLHFEGQSKKLGLNTTACKTLESLTGRVVPLEWVGFAIQLYVDPQAKYPGGEKGPAIRIRPTLPRGQQAETAPMVEPSPEVLERLEEEKEARLGDEREPGID